MYSYDNIDNMDNTDSKQQHIESRKPTKSVMLYRQDFDDLIGQFDASTKRRFPGYQIVTLAMLRFIDDLKAGRYTESDLSDYMASRKYRGTFLVGCPYLRDCHPETANPHTSIEREED